MRKARSGKWKGQMVTTLVVVVASIALFPLFSWAVLDAVWGAQPEAGCREVVGACWPIIAEKWTLIIFGRYPSSELWRPVLATTVLLGTALMTSVPRFWSKGLLAAWVVAPVLFFILMRGGSFGLSPVSWDQWGGLPITIMLSVFGIGLAFPIGVLLACARVSSKPVISWLAAAYIETVRGVPLITVLFMAAFIFPLLLPEGWNLNAIIRAQIAIILFTAAYLAEVVRGGLQYVSKGQFEACEALGLSRFQGYRYIVLPQALSLVIAPMVNTSVTLLMDTSLVAIISISELLLSARQALADPVWRTHFIEVYIFIAAIYFVFCFGMGRWSKRLERSYSFDRAPE